MGYKFTTNQELKTAVDEWISDKPTALSSYGEINTWDTSSITDMSSLFASTTFNDDISRWNTSKVTNMKEMFAEASAFNQDIGNWDVSQVTTMTGMFQNAAAFNQYIGQWNVSAVTDMQYMLSGAAAFNQDIGQWPIKDETNLDKMFCYSGVNEETFLKHPKGTGKGIYGEKIGRYFRLPGPYESYDMLKKSRGKWQSIINKRNLEEAGLSKLLNKDLTDENLPNKNKGNVNNKIRVLENLGTEIQSYLGGSHYRINYTFY